MTATQPLPVHARHPGRFLAPAALLLGAALSLGGCGDRPGRAGESEDGAQPGTAGEVAVIRGLTNGDRACYVELEGAGEPQEASFELCERAELVGQRVRLARERTPIQAASCEGNPECSRSDTVDLIVSAQVLP